jgi:hypothetical protein
MDHEEEPRHPPPSSAVSELLDSVSKKELSGDLLPVSAAFAKQQSEKVARARRQEAAALARWIARGGVTRLSHARTGGTMSAACLLCRYKIPAIKTQIGTVDVPVGLCQKCSSLSCGSHGERTGTPAFLCILCDSSLQASSAGWNAFVNRGGLDKLPGGAQALSGLATSGQAGDRGGPSPRAHGETVDLAHALALLFSEPDGSPSPLVVRNLEEWTAARPGYRDLMSVLADLLGRAVQAIDTFLRPGASQPGPASRPAGTARTGLDGYDFGDVGSLWASLDDSGKRLLASAVLLIVVLELPVDMMPAPVAAAATILGGVLRDDFSDEISGIHERVVARR